MSNNAIEIRKRKRADAKITSNNGGLLGGIGYAGEKVLLGALQSVEGIADFTVGGIADLVGADEFAEQVMDDDWVNYGHADEWYNPKGAMKVVGDVAGGIGTSLPAIGAAIGAGAMTYFSGGAAAPAAIKLLGAAAAPLVAGTGAAGNATKEAYRESGKLTGKEWGYGALVGGTEAGVELVSGKLLGAGTGRIFKEMSEGAVKSAGKYGVKGVAKTLGKEMLSEGLEEGIATAVSPVWARMTYNPNAEWATPSEIGYDAFIGAMSGLIMGGTTNAVSYGQSVRTGKKVSDAGKADALVKQAKYGLLKLGQDAKTGDTLLEGIDDMDGGILAKHKLRSDIKKTAKNRADATEAVEQALARWESLSEKQRASWQGFEVLGDLQRNDFLLRANSWVEDRVNQLSKQSDEALADVAAQVKEAVGQEYTVAELRADKDDILTRIAANELSLTGVEPEDSDALSGVETVDAKNGSAKSFDTPASQTAQDDSVGRVENDVAAIRAEAKALGVDESYAELAAQAYKVGGLRNLSATDFTRSFITAVRMSEAGASVEGLLKERQVARLDTNALAFAVEKGRKLARNKKASARAKGVRYSTDGKRVVVEIQPDAELEQRIRSASTSTERHNAIRQYLIEQCEGKTFQMSDGKRAVMDRSDAQHLAQNTSSVRIAEVSNIREIVESAVVIGPDVDAEHRKFSAFSYYAVTASFDGNAYDILINVGKAKNDGTYHIYDITPDNRKGRTAGQASPGLSRVTKTGVIRNGSSTHSVPQPPSIVKPSAQKNIRRASRSGNAGKVILADDIRVSEEFDDRQYAAYKAAELMAKALGTDIVFHRSMGHAGETAAGYFDPSDGSIHININAMREIKQDGKWDGKHIALYTLGHETVHYIKAWSPAKYAELEAFVMEKLGGRAEALLADKRAQLTKMGDLEGLTDTEADALVREEVVADSMELVLADGEVLAELQKRNRTLWEKIRDYVTSVIEKVKAAYGNLSYTSKSAQVLRETVESLDEIKQLFYEGVVEASEARKSAQAESVTGMNQGKGQVKFSVSDENIHELSPEDQKLLFDKEFYENYSGESRDQITETVEELEAFKKTPDFKELTFEEAYDVNAKLKALQGGYRTLYDYYVETAKQKVLDEYSHDEARGRQGKIHRKLEEKRRLIAKKEKLSDQIAGATDLQDAQFRIIQETNPMWDDYHTGIRSPKEIRTFAEVAEDPESFEWGDFSREDAQKALRDGTVRIYSSYPIKNGVFVSTSYKQALQYAGMDPNGVHSRVVALDSVAWINGDEGQYAKVYKKKFSTSDDITESGAEDSAVEKQKITVGMSDSERAEILRHKKIAPSVVQIREEFDVDWEALEHNRWDVVKKPLLKKMREFGYLTHYRTDSVDVAFDFTGEGFRKSMNSQVSDYGGTLADFAKVVMNMQGLLDNAVLIEVHADKAKGTPKENSRLLQTYVLLSAYQEDAQITPVQFEIKQYVDDQNRLYLAVAMTKIEADVISDTALQEGERTRLLPASTYSIADFVQKINPRDENFFKYIPDEFLTSEQKEAKQRALAKENAKYGRKFSTSDDIVESRDMTEDTSHDQERGMVGYVFDGEFLVADSNSMHRRLAEALESMVDNSKDYNTLKKYKERLWELDELQSKQQMLRERVSLYEKVLYEGATPSIRKEGYARLQEVRDELNKVSKELAQINKSLVGMSTLQPLRNLLEQENKSANNYYREKYQKMDQERVEKRNRSEGARKLEKKLSQLYRRLFDPTKKWHIPAEMQESVKAALAATNMETEWVTKVAKLEAELERLNGLKDKGVPNSHAIAEIEAELEAVMAERESLSEQMKFGIKLFELFGIAKSETVNSAFDAEMSRRLLEYQEIVGDTPIYQLTAKQLEAANQFYQVLITRIGVANQLFLDGKQQALETEGNKAIDEIDEIHVPKWLKPRKGEKGATTAGKKLFWDSLKPQHFFEVIGSDSLLRVFKDLRRGEGKWARVIRKAERFADKTAKKYKYHEWDLKTRHDFKTANEKTISLTLDEMMALYELYQRPTAYKNLTEGGVKHSPDATTNDTFGKTKIPKPKGRLNDNSRYVWDEASFQRVFDALTDEQKAFADEMQRYMADEMGALGNEVSMYLYGIELFTDPNYFTMDVDDSVTASQTGRTGDPKITNKSFTQRVAEKGSSAPLILHGLMDVWTAHVNDMALYYAFAIPTDNLSKMLNYKKTAVRDADTGEWTGKAVKDMPSDSLSLKDALITQYGEQSVKYIEQLLRDLNGGARTDGAADLLSKGLSLFKRASVVGSLSVVFQQPSSIGRAFSMIHPKYLANAKGFNFKDYEAMQAELEEFAPLAIIKDMGGFDTGIGSRTADYLMPKEYKGIKKKAAALALDSTYRNEVFGFLANKADQLAWFTIWEGCKREQAELLNKPTDSKEVLEAAGERFEDIIVHTQVYDSTLSRSQIMRSKDSGAQMVTTFMAEQTTTANMMMVGLVQFSRTKNAKILRNVVGSILISAILNSILASLIYAARDDDEEKNYGEKYVEQLTGGLMDSMNPLTYFPYLRDIWSIAQGYEVERSDMAVVYDFYTAINGMGSSEKSWLEKSMNLGANVGTLFGLPTRNLYRDGRGIYNVMTNAGGDGATAAGAKYAVRESAVSMIPFGKLLGVSADASNGYQLYDSMVAGDEAHQARVRARFATQSEADKALRVALRDKDARIRQAAMARYEGDMATYSSLVREVKAEGIFSQDLIVTAVNGELAAIKRDYESGAEDNADPDAVEENAAGSSLYTSADLNGQLEAGDYAEAKVIITDMVNTKVADGKTKKQAQALVKSGVTRYWKEKYLAAYKAKNAAECKRIRAILKQTGLYGTTSDILEVTQDWVKATTK